MPPNPFGGTREDSEWDSPWCPTPKNALGAGSPFGSPKEMSGGIAGGMPGGFPGGHPGGSPGDAQWDLHSKGAASRSIPPGEVSFGEPPRRCLGRSRRIPLVNPPGGPTGGCPVGSPIDLLPSRPPSLLSRFLSLCDLSSLLFYISISSVISLSSLLSSLFSLSLSSFASPLSSSPILYFLSRFSYIY